MVILNDFCHVLTQSQDNPLKHFVGREHSIIQTGIYSMEENSRRLYKSKCLICIRTSRFTLIDNTCFPHGLELRTLGNAMENIAYHEWAPILLINVKQVDKHWFQQVAVRILIMLIMSKKARQGKFIYTAPFSTRQPKVLYKMK